MLLISKYSMTSHFSSIAEYLCKFYSIAKSFWQKIMFIIDHNSCLLLILAWDKSLTFVFLWHAILLIHSMRNFLTHKFSLFILSCVFLSLWVSFKMHVGAHSIGWKKPLQWLSFMFRKGKKNLLYCEWLSSIVKSCSTWTLLYCKIFFDMNCISKKLHSSWLIVFVIVIAHACISRIVSCNINVRGLYCLNVAF